MLNVPLRDEKTCLKVRDSKVREEEDNGGYEHVSGPTLRLHTQKTWKRFKIWGDLNTFKKFSHWSFLGQYSKARSWDSQRPQAVA